jgi:exosortase
MKNNRDFNLPLILSALFTGIAWVLCHGTALLSLHQRWVLFDQAYAVGYPAVGLTVWWLFRHRKILHDKISGPFWPALIPLILVLLAGSAGLLVQLQLLAQLAALSTLWLIPLFLFGWPVARMLLLPAALLSLTVPMWDVLVDPLRGMTVWFTQHVLDSLHIPAYIDGYFITLPAGVVEVANGCSGLNLLLAMMLVGLMFVESHLMSPFRRLCIVALAIAFGLIDNWVRVLLLVLIAYFSEMQSDLVHHHGNFGWWVFAIGLLPYFWFATRIERRLNPQPSPFVGTGALPRREALLIGVLMICVWGGTEQLQQRRGAASAGLQLPVAGVAAKAQWLPEYSGQDVMQVWRVPLGPRLFDVTALTYIEQRADKKLIYYSNRIAAEGKTSNAGHIELAPGFAVNTLLLNEGGARQVWWFWWVDGGTSTGALRTKLLQLKAMLVGDPSAALIVVTARCARTECARTLAEPDAATQQLLLALRDTRIAR